MFPSAASGLCVQLVGLSGVLILSRSRMGHITGLLSQHPPLLYITMHNPWDITKCICFPASPTLSRQRTACHDQHYLRILTIRYPPNVELISTLLCTCRLWRYVSTWAILHGYITIASFVLLTGLTMFSPAAFWRVHPCSTRSICRFYCEANHFGLAKYASTFVATSTNIWHGTFDHCDYSTEYIARRS